MACPEPFIMLPHSLILNEQFQSLSSSSIRLYLILLTRWNRDKEKIRKPLIFTYEQLKEVSQLSFQTISTSLKELEAKDFVSITYGGKNNPNRYEITYKWLVK